MFVSIAIGIIGILGNLPQNDELGQNFAQFEIPLE
jgi:hypothetical protein